ncbi:MAG: Circadian input kinase A, partial [uncultured Gemmatimonadaceae bacterium]
DRSRRAPRVQDPARRGQRPEPRHAHAAPRAARLHDGERPRRRRGGRGGGARGAGPDPHGHEPPGARRLGRHGAAQELARDPDHPGDRAHGARHGRRPRAGARGGVRRLRHQARRAAAAAREDRGAARAADAV